MMKRTGMALALTIVASGATIAAEGEHGLTVTEKEEGSVSREQGLQAWSNIHEVISHPRCANCHTDEVSRPMWSGPEFKEARPHGMNINAGESRTGAETIPCQTCHVTSTLPNDTPHAPPHTGMEWHLAPVEMVWFGVAENEICAQLRDPERNGGRDGAALIEHITHDAEVKGLISWGFDPGGGREAAPGSMQQHLDDTINWIAAGMPCPQD